MQIARNSGVEGAIVVDKVMKSKDLNFGFNADTLKYGDLVKQGVIDLTKVVRCALENAASVSSLLLTTGAVIAEIPESRPASAAGGGAMGRRCRRTPPRARGRLASHD
jgi:chaperonin GroEL